MKMLIPSLGFLIKICSYDRSTMVLAVRKRIHSYINKKKGRKQRHKLRFNVIQNGDLCLLGFVFSLHWIMFGSFPDLILIFFLNFSSIFQKSQNLGLHWYSATLQRPSALPLVFPLTFSSPFTRGATRIPRDGGLPPGIWPRTPWAGPPSRYKKFGTLVRPPSVWPKWANGPLGPKSISGPFQAQIPF